MSTQPPRRWVTRLTVCVVACFGLIALGAFLAPKLWTPPASPAEQLQAYGDHHHHHGDHHHHDHVSGHGHLSGLEATAENYRQVLKEIDRRLETEPDNKRLRGAKVHIGLDYEPTVAIRECEKLLRDNPRDYFALTHLAYGHYSNGEMERAVHFATAALNQEETEGLLVLIGHAHFQRRKFSLARDHYQRALAIKPASEAAKLGLSRAEAQLAAANPLDGTQ